MMRTTPEGQRERFSRARWRRTTLFAVAFYAVATVVARRRGYSGLGGWTLVRCSQGHLFRTIWVPGVSLKAIRLGWYRAQFCPVGRHWTLVSPVTDADAATGVAPLRLVPRDVGLP